MRAPIVAVLVVAAACSREPAPGLAPEAAVEGVSQATPTPSPRPPPATSESSVSPPEAEGVQARDLILSEWRAADNRSTCAPVGFAGAGEGGVPRRAHFAGGWAVAWDRPDLRSAFGVAGTGVIPEQEQTVAEQRARLARQWPRFRELPDLPRPAFAGYGIEGGRDFPDDNPQGAGLNSLAYVRIGGQRCDYNVWSRLGRAHLESLLASLRVVKP